MILSLNLPTTALPPGRRPNNGINPTTASKAGVSPLAANPMFQDLKAALDRWRQWWQAVRSQATDESMKMAGMYRHSFHFWLVLKLIVNKEDAVDVITRMEVNCEDALTKLKVLFQNDGDPD
jgi:formylmethanofuran dehydrogenase subunit E-like metal-binding protein